MLDSGEFVINWTPFNFEPSTSNFHVHFFYDVYDAAQAGTNAAQNGTTRGSWQLTDETSFSTAGSSVSVAGAPADATAICVTAADSGHGIVNPENVECVDLADPTGDLDG